MTRFFKNRKYGRKGGRKPTTGVYPKMYWKIPPQSVREEYVSLRELEFAGSWQGELAEKEVRRLLAKWPALLTMDPDEFEAISQDLEARYP